MSVRLAEPETRINQEPVLGDTVTLSVFDAFSEELKDISHHISVDRSLLHGPGRTLHMHEDDGDLELGHGRRHFSVKTKGADIIDHPRTLTHCRASNLRFIGIHGKGNAQSFGTS